MPRATIATSAPDCAKRVATAKPMPLLPPVTMAVRPERLISMKQLPTIPHDGTALFLALPESGGKGHRAILRATMRWIFLPDDALTGSSSSSTSAAPSIASRISALSKAE